MKQIWAITKLNLKLLWRQKIILAMLLIIPAISLGIFFILSPDKDIVKDIQFRIQYAYTAAYTVLTLMAIFIGAYVTRSQIDAKNIHFITSFPVSRWKIFIGQFLANTFLLLLNLIVLIIVIISSSFYYQSKHADKLTALEKSQLRNTRFEIKPTPLDLDQLTRDRLKSFNVKVEKISAQDWILYVEQTRRELQRLRPGQTKSWSFPAIDKELLKSKDLDLFVRLNGRASQEKVPLEIKIISSQGSKSFQAEAPTYQYHKITLDSDAFPSGEDFRIELRHGNKSELLISYSSGIKILFQDSTFLKNTFNALILQALHLPVLNCLGMTAGICFSFAVAGLISLVTFLFSFADFLSNALIYVDVEKLSPFEIFSANLLRYGLKVTQGIQSPPIIENIAQNLTIPFFTILNSWGPAIALNFLTLALLGTYFLKRKELDKVQS